jgi:hypothetical protein
MFDVPIVDPSPINCVVPSSKILPVSVVVDAIQEPIDSEIRSP